MFHPRAHWLKNTIATNEHVAAYIRLYLHLKAQRSVLESIQSQFSIKLENLRQKNEQLLLSQVNKNEENQKKDEKRDADEMILKNCILSINIILKSDIKTAIFEASNFIMKTKDFPLSICSPETTKLVNIFSTSCVTLIKFPSTLLANFYETNKKNNISNPNSPKNNNIKAKKEKTLLDAPMRAYIENTSSSDEYEEYSVEYTDDSTYSTLSISNNDANTSSINEQNANNISPDYNKDKKNNEDESKTDNIKENESNDTKSNISHEENISAHNSNSNIKTPKRRSQKHKRIYKKRSAKGPPSTVICRLCNEAIPIDLFAEHIKSCAIAFKSELKVQDVNQMLLQEYDAIGNEFISAPWPGERQRAVSVTLPMLHLSILLMRSHDIEENTNDSLEELESIEHSILHIPFVIDFDDKDKSDQKKEGNALYRNVSNYNNDKIKPSKNKYKKISLKPVGSGLLNHFSKRKVRNIPIKKSSDGKNSTDDGTVSDTSANEADYNGNDNNNDSNNIISANNSTDYSETSANTSRRNSVDLTIDSPVLKYVNESLKLLREKINLTVVLCAASDILSKTRLSGSDKITTIKSVRITNFEFIKLISAGAYARVFLAQMKTTGDVCAVKVTPKASCTHKNEVLQLITEKNIMLKFNNPYIVTFCLNNLYLVMEYLPGGDLYSLLQNIGSFDEDTAKLYTFEIVLALKYLHTNGIIHRDLKPDNILISKEGKIKLTDFGLSHLGLIDRRNNEEPAEPEETKIIGTPDYIAPEILLEKKHTYTCDYWSLGCMVYEFLIGIPPFHADTEEETFKNILRGHIDLSSDVGIEDFSDEAIDFIKALLVTDPTQRLGANGIDDIINHPWFKGVDPDKDNPPFIPELNDKFDTDYFKQRYEFKDDDSDIIEDINDEIEKEKEKESEKQNQPIINSQNLLPVAGSSSSDISSIQSKEIISSDLISDNNTTTSSSIIPVNAADNSGVVISDSDKFDYLGSDIHSHSGVINIENNQNGSTSPPIDSPLVPLPTSFSSNVLNSYTSVGVEQIIRRNEEILSYAQKQQEEQQKEQEKQRTHTDEEVDESLNAERRKNRQRAKYLAKKKPASFDMTIDSKSEILTEFYNLVRQKNRESKNIISTNKNDETENKGNNNNDDDDQNGILNQKQDQNQEQNSNQDELISLNHLNKVLKSSNSQQRIMLSLTDSNQSETEPSFTLPPPEPHPAPKKSSQSQISNSNSIGNTSITINNEVNSICNINNNNSRTLPQVPKLQPSQKVSCSSTHPAAQLPEPVPLYHSISYSGSDPFEKSEKVKTMILSQFSSSPVTVFVGVNEFSQPDMAKVSKSARNFIQQSNSAPESAYDNNHSRNNDHVTSSGSDNSSIANSNLNSGSSILDPLTAFSESIEKSKNHIIILDSPYTMKSMKSWEEDPRAALRRIRAKHRKNVKKLSSMLCHHQIHDHNV